MARSLLFILLMLCGIAQGIDGEEGVATYYTYDDYGGGPLYASRTLMYDPSNSVLWCAVNVRSYEEGLVEPGDVLAIEFVDHNIVLYLEAWDAGPFDGYHVEDWADLPILVDVPEHLWPLDTMSARVVVYNVSADERGELNGE